jgi:hypothetical protein
MIVMDTEEVAAVTEIPDEVQRWTAKRRSALVLSIIVHGHEKVPTYGHQKVPTLALS